MGHLLAAAAVLVLVGVAGAGGVGWYYSDEILIPPRPSSPTYDTRVEAVAGDTVTLQATRDARQPGVWGLELPDAYGRVHDVVTHDAATVTRRLERLDGSPRAGQRADVEAAAYPNDPADARLGVSVSEVFVPGPLGRYPAWQAGDGRLWAVLVHGRAADRSQCFRMLAILVERDLTALCVTYRNDPGAPASPDGLYHQGATEWRDVAAAVDHARRHGAAAVVLVGYSMGAQITANVLRHAEQARDVDAVIWDAPLLDWGPALQRAADDRDAPRAVVPLGMLVSGLRVGVDYDDLNHVAAAAEFDVPILLFHGTEDATVPVAGSDAFAAARMDLVTYERVAGAGHGHAWNVDPAAYERAVARFLRANGLLPTR